MHYTTALAQNKKRTYFSFQLKIIIHNESANNTSATLCLKETCMNNYVDQFRFLGNYLPTPPLIQHFALRGGVGGQFPRRLSSCLSLGYQGASLSEKKLSQVAEAQFCRPPPMPTPPSPLKKYTRIMVLSLLIDVCT